jgi:hypothetical protein
MENPTVDISGPNLRDRLRDPDRKVIEAALLDLYRRRDGDSELHARCRQAEEDWWRRRQRQESSS